MRMERVNERTFGRGGVRIETMYWATDRTVPGCGLGYTAEAARLHVRRRPWRRRR